MIRKKNNKKEESKPNTGFSNHRVNFHFVFSVFLIFLGSFFFSSLADRASVSFGKYHKFPSGWQGGNLEHLNQEREVREQKRINFDCISNRCFNKHAYLIWREILGVGSSRVRLFFIWIHFLSCPTLFLTPSDGEGRTHSFRLSLQLGIMLAVV